MTPPSYELIRSARRTLALEVSRDGRVLVRAPMGLSQKRIDAFAAAHQDWIAAQQARQAQRRAAHPEPSAAERAGLIRKAQEVLPAKTAYYGNLMNLHPTGITITGAEKRFGSCSAKNRICYSWRLMAYPEAAIDYVVVHELAHILHKNHGKEFYACIESILPDWRARRNLLKE